MGALLVKIGKIKLLWKRSGFLGGIKIIFNYLLTYCKAFFVGSGDVLFISSGVGDSAHYRAYNVAEELKLHDFKAATTISDNPNLPKLADKFKIFVFHRTAHNKNLEKMVERIKEQGKEIIFETDDLVYDPAYLAHMDYFKKMSVAEQELYRNGIGAEIVNDSYVKTCTATVSYLADKLREKGKRVIIVPNKFSESEFELVENVIKNEKLQDGFLRIVYCSGTLSHNKDFETIKEALIFILKKYEKVKLLFIGPLDIPEELRKFENKIEIVPRIPRSEVYKNLYRADINLAPLEIDNPFCEAKSAIKFTEAAALGIPTVAIANQTFSEAITNGVDGFLASGTEEWINKLEILIEDGELRKKMGQAAREKVLKFYTNRNSQNEEYYQYLKNKL